MDCLDITMPINRLPPNKVKVRTIVCGGMGHSSIQVLFWLFDTRQNNMIKYLNTSIKVHLCQCAQLIYLLDLVLVAMRCPVSSTFGKCRSVALSNVSNLDSASSFP